MEFSKRCPYIGCGETMDDEAASLDRLCSHCGAGITMCAACHAANRLLAGYCRGCGAGLGAEIWPCHPGLRTATFRSSISSIKKARVGFPVHLGRQAIASPLAVSGLLIVSLADGSIDLLSEHTGRRLGRLGVPEEIVVTPAMHAGRLFVAAGRKVYCHDLARYLDQSSDTNGKPVWSCGLGGGSAAHPALVDERTVYLASQDGETTTLHALSQEDGSAIWDDAPRFECGPTAPPLLVNDQIVVISLSGEAFLVNLASGTIEQTFPMRREVEPQVAPFVADNRIILADKRHCVFEIVLNSSDGPSINELHAMRARVTSLAAADDFIVAGHLSGLTLLDRRGHQRWSADDIDPVSVTPIVAGDTVFALDDAGNGLLFNALKSNPVGKVRLFGGEVGPPPLITRTSIAAVSAAGDVVAIEWQ